MSPAQETFRYLPYDVVIEQNLLGSLILDNRLIDTVAADLSPHHLYDPLHQRIFETIIYAQGQGKVTPLTLHAAMKADHGLNEIGGHSYLVGLAQAAPAMPNVGDYVRILLELSARRDLIRIGEDLVNDAYESPRDAPAQLISDRTTDALLSVGRETSKPVLSPYDIAYASLKRVEDMLSGKPVPMVKTGLTKLDEEIGGLRGGDMILVPSKSGMGKSTILGTFGLNVARGNSECIEALRRPQIPTIVFSLEMTREQWVERMICDIDFDTAPKAMWYSRIRNGRLSADEFARFGSAMQMLHGLPLEIRDEDDLTIQQIGARARAFKAKHGNPPLGLVLIDYAQIVTPTDLRAPREQQVAGIARGAKSLAKRLGWPVVMGSQVNENDAARSKDEKRPQLGDARESKALGNEADLALSPFRPAYFVENRKPIEALPGDPSWLTWKAELAACMHRMELLALKNRHGRRFDLELYCDMGASAIRDQEPYRPTEADQNAADLLQYGMRG